MKHFKLVLTLTRIVVAVLFVANFIFMAGLYNSIKERYMDDVEQCLRRADLIELIDRLTREGYDEDGVISMWIGLVKSDVGAAQSTEELQEVNYSQGYKRMDRQLISVITQYLHNAYGEDIGTPDIGLLEEAFRRELNFSEFYPDEVVVVDPDGCTEVSGDLWKLEHRVDGVLIYEAYISPLTGDVLSEMSGVIVTSVLIALVLTFGFWYLLHVIARLRTIEEMKDDFVSNMTHELKTPIAIAYAANDSLLQFPDPADEERTKKYLTAALEQLTKLTGLVENILSMSMERRKHLMMKREEIKLKPFLETIAGQQKIKTDKDCTIIVDCGDDVVVNADPTHFSNVIGNLIDNSIKYSGESVTIVIKADGESISVSDNGIGIPQGALDDIFKKFYRVPHGNKRDVSGYGIGLFYVKSIVDKHGWTIRVESREGRGSRFTITTTSKSGDK